MTSCETISTPWQDSECICAYTDRSGANADNSTSAGTLCDEDGRLFIKPCTQKEIDFYQHVQREVSDPADSKEKYRDLVDILPVFMGTLMLTDVNDERISEAVTGVVSNGGSVTTDKAQITTAVSEQVAQAVAAVKEEQASTMAPDQDGKAAPAVAPEQDWVPTNGGRIKTDTAIVLGNASYGFTKPNVLDLKLGVRLHANDAPAKKKAKMEKLSSETTHRSHGFRISGMKTYRGRPDSTIPAQQQVVDDEGFLIYDKDYGRSTVTEDNVSAEISKFVFNPDAGIDKELGQAVCRGLATEIANVEATIEQHEFTMYSASLLILVEGDGEALRRAISLNNAEVEAVEEQQQASKAAKADAAKRVDSGVALDDEGEFIDVHDAGATSDFDDDDVPPPIFSVKLIDFAHVDWTPGQGPDRNLLKGVSSVRKLFEELAGDA